MTAFRCAAHNEEKFMSARTTVWRRVWLWGRWVVGAAFASLALWACNSERLVKPEPMATRAEQNIFQQAINRNIDIIFEIDNSVSMAPEQANLVANFPVFINVLKNLPGGLPNVHIGVVTSDMGAGAFTSSVNGCEKPDNGNFVDQVRAATDPICATAKLNAGQHFIVSASAGSQNNFAGDITDVFRCIAQVGTTGCGFEDHLEAVRAALGDPTADPAHDIPVRPVPPNNAGFLRPDAYLAVIYITNEEECSTSPDNVLYDVTPGSDATLGPLTTRCFGHTDVCDGQPVVNYVQAGNPMGPFQSCVPDETTFATDPKHGPIPVQFYVDHLKKQKADTTKILLSGIIAPSGPYSLVTIPDGHGGMVMAQGNSCTGAAGVFGQPTPRWTKFFAAFAPPQVVTTSICDQSFAAAMQRIAEQLGRLLGAPCIDGTVLDVMGPKGPRPDCTVVDHTFSAAGAQVDTPVASCVDNGNQAPCWSLAAGTANQCPGQSIMQFMRPPNQPPPSDLNSSVECSILTCTQGVHNPPACP
jgi:hypothetical protein